MDEEWLDKGFSLSPFSLPLQKGAFIPKADPFEGLFGIFADSLPDGFGRLLVDRLLLTHNINPHEIGRSANRNMIILSAQSTAESKWPKQSLSPQISAKAILAQSALTEQETRKGRKSEFI